jgi:DNA-binding NtrC family response regulator
MTEKITDADWDSGSERIGMKELRRLVLETGTVGVKQLFGNLPDKQLQRCNRVLHRLRIERRQMEVKRLENEIDYILTPYDESFDRPTPEAMAGSGVNLEEAVKAFERQIIVEALEQCRGNLSKTSRHLDTTRRILSYKVEQFGIDPKSYKKR